MYTSYRYTITHNGEKVNNEYRTFEAAYDELNRLSPDSINGYDIVLTAFDIRNGKNIKKPESLMHRIIEQRTPRNICDLEIDIENEIISTGAWIAHCYAFEEFDMYLDDIQRLSAENDIDCSDIMAKHATAKALSEKVKNWLSDSINRKTFEQADGEFYDAIIAFSQKCKEYIEKHNIEPVRYQNSKAV